MSDYVAALSAGLAGQPGALIIVRKDREIGELDPATYERPARKYVTAVALERLPEHLSGPEIADLVRVPLRVAPLTDNTRLVVDLSSGRPPVDYLRSRCLHMGVSSLTPVLPVSGDAQDSERIPVKALVSRLKIEMEKNAWRLPPQLPLVGELTGQIERLGLEQTWREDGGELAAVLILAVWFGLQPEGGFIGGPALW